MRIAARFLATFVLGSFSLVACSPDSSGTTSGSSFGAGGEDATSSSSDSSSASSGKGGDADGSGPTVQSSSGTSTSNGGAGPGSTGTGGDDATSASTGGAGPGSTGTGGETGSGGEGGSPPDCEAGTIQCQGSLQRVCDGNGGFVETECAPGGCLFGVGCVACQPGTGFCDGNTSNVCRNDGSGYDVSTCQADQGVTCNPGNGECEGACAPEEIGSSYIGCDYYPTVTINPVPANFSFAVAVANTANAAANILVTRGDVTVVNDSVAANSVKLITLPWVSELKDAAGTVAVADGAYRLQTTQPVSVYQYSPLEYTNGADFSFTNDASLLLPVNAWTGNYRVVARASLIDSRGFYAITASEDGTTVSVAGSAVGGTIEPGAGLPENGIGTVTMQRGDVLQVLSFTDFQALQTNDVTGTLVTADKPVQVIGGHRCTYIPYDVLACDHLEESIPPVETLGTEYFVTAPLIPTGGTTPKAEMVRIVATEAATTLTYDPPQAAPATIANAGEYIELQTTLADFKVSSDKPVIVAQYMLGQEFGGGSGDPAMALAVALEQYRDEYLFHAPTSYETNYVNVTAPTAASITLDGAPVGGFVAIGGTGYGIARVPLSNGGDGNHVITGTMPFGISVYGYGQYTSYWYPGGLDLDQVN